MLYACVKIIARLAFPLYCRNLSLNKKEHLQLNGPLLLAANHPNSFLDAIVLCTIFNRPVYSLARGDVFKKSFVARILLALKLLPVYRVSEGVENLDENYKTFDRCKEIFKQNGIVLIFSEGRCVNEWHLRPLKKGTARLAISSWEDGIPLRVLPVGINYNSFRKFGKNTRLSLGELISSKDVDLTQVYGRSVLQFNTILTGQLQPFVHEIQPTDHQQLHATFYIPQPVIKKILLFIPASIGLILHAPLYLPVKRFVLQKIRSTDHFDSLMVALLFMAYPIYLFVLTILTGIITRSWIAAALLALLPFTAWAYVQLKDQMDT